MAYNDYNIKKINIIIFLKLRSLMVVLSQLIIYYYYKEKHKLKIVRYIIFV